MARWALERALIRDPRLDLMLDRVRPRLGQLIGHGGQDRRHDAALVNLADMGRVDEPVTAGQPAAVEDDAVEDVDRGLGE